MRINGILMPVFSLPSNYGIGTLGKEAYRFVDFLSSGGQSLWQVLPVGPTGYGDSPYQSFSTFAGNPYFIDLELLCEHGYLTSKECECEKWGKDPEKVSYDLLYNARRNVLCKAFGRFVKNIPSDYDRFCNENAFWLDDYALYCAIKRSQGERPLQEWDKKFLERASSAIRLSRESMKNEIDYCKVVQYLFFSQWKALKKYANGKGIKIMGDLPFYISADSSDVFASPENFLLDEGYVPSVVAGVPPDAFSADGQLWGNPIYDWDYMKKDGYSWWEKRISFACSMFDLVRIDHFRGFDSYFCIPSGDKNAERGKWRKGPGMEFFSALSEKLGSLPFIAEDLGMLTPSVGRLLKDSGFPGMKVLQFAFDPNDNSAYLPHNHIKNCVVYTGTHDNDTVNGWFDNAPADQTEFAKKYLNLSSSQGNNWGMIRAAMASTADTCIITMQDIIGLGSEARINTPSKFGGNWQWRIKPECINSWLANVLLEYTEIYRRLPER